MSRILFTSNIHIHVLSEHGLLIARLYHNLVHLLSTDKLQLETIKILKNNKETPTLNLKLYVNKDLGFLNYDELSGAQTLLADILFLDRLLEFVGGVGFMYLDELFKFFDAKYVKYASEYLKELRATQLFLVVHGHQIAIANHHIEVNMNEYGSTHHIFQ